ncbi:hypothetical protein P5673_023316 [Acropora cervicornis]|uniref:Uncharacterized protein n=1 Tax=Acropora cervicornis TaxID=6130 RepID=A0AAD9UYS3_ACRCE|nr:hypothetical protein P5673_023316 [Acropora cervicornis]
MDEERKQKYSFNCFEQKPASETSPWFIIQDALRSDNNSINQSLPSVQVPFQFRYDQPSRQY